MRILLLIKLNAKRNSLLLILVVSILNNILSQPCYVQLPDVSGFNISTYQADLEFAACQLKLSLPGQYQSDFKVFDFGFYSMNEYTIGDSEAAWNSMKLDIRQQSSYYLLFGKVTNQNGLYDEILIDFKLPEGSSECFTREAFIREKLKQILRSDSNPLTYADREIRAMQWLSILSCEICDNGIDDDGDGYVDCNDLDCVSTNESLKGDQIVNSKNSGNCYQLSEVCINSIDSFTVNSDNNQWLQANLDVLDWSFAFMAENGCTEETSKFVLEALQLKKVNQDLVLSRLEELYALAVGSSTVFFDGCFPSSNIIEQDYAHLFNHSLPQECVDRLDQLGDDFMYQNLDDAHSPAINMDHYSAEITMLPDFDGDGSSDDSSVLFEEIRKNFLTLASGSKQDFNSNCMMGGKPDIWWSFQDYPTFSSPSSTERWLGNDPISSIFLIDAGAAGPIDNAFADLGAVIVSDITGCCWVFSTLTTPISGSQPFSGHRQFGIRTNERGNLEFFTRAVDRAKLTILMGAMFNDACSYEDYFDIGDVTWTGLISSVVSFVNNNGGAATVYRGDFIRPNYTDIKDRLTSQLPIEINCN